MNNTCPSVVSSVVFTRLRTPAEWVSSEPTEDPTDLDALRAVSNYVLYFLTNEHPELGRSGPVCPFATGGLKAGMVQITGCSLDSIDGGSLATAIDTFREMFGPLPTSGIEKRNEIYRSIMIVFPRLPVNGGPALIEQVQTQLKPAFVSQGLMIGEFYPECSAPGVHNADFRPLRAPVTSIAIRRITVFDAPFMLDDPNCLASYLDRFGDAGRTRIKEIRDAMALR